DSLVSGDRSGFDVDFDPGPGGRGCAALQFTQRVVDLQPGFVHDLENLAPDELVIFRVFHSLTTPSISAAGLSSPGPDLNYSRCLETPYCRTAARLGRPWGTVKRGTALASTLFTLPRLLPSGISH